MAGFLSQAIADLTRQLGYAPAARAREQMDRAEELYWEIESERNYPLEFVAFRITRFRVDNLPAMVLTGTAVRHDLLVFVERLSELVNDQYEAYDPPPHDLSYVCRTLNVTAKTISRYRRAGLFARRLIQRDGKVKLGFLDASVNRFRDARCESLIRSARFTRMDEKAIQEILRRARRITARVSISPYAVARHLGRKFGRSTETVRQILLKHDQHDRRVAIFRKYQPPLSEKQQKLIQRAYRWGIPVAHLAKRFHKSRQVIYRSLNLWRAATLKASIPKYIYSKTFDLPDAEQVILKSEISEHTHESPDKVPDAASEVAWFARYNYLKYRAACEIKALDPYHPKSSHLDQIETLLRHAARVRLELTHRFLRLVISVARKHMAGSRDTARRSLADLVGDGNVVLMETLETYDTSRGNRYSTYLSWALMKRFAQSRGKPFAVTNQLDIPVIDSHDFITHVENLEHVTQSLAVLMQGLDARERYILTHHFGLSGSAGEKVEPVTMVSIAGELNISPERVRQIERRALLKLRSMAAELSNDK